MAKLKFKKETKEQGRDLTIDENQLFGSGSLGGAEPFECIEIRQ